MVMRYSIASDTSFAQAMPYTPGIRRTFRSSTSAQIISVIRKMTVHPSSASASSSLP